MARSRPIFLPKLGGFLVKLRDARGWNQSEAVSRATRRNIRLAYNAYRWLEEGKIESPDPDLLRAVSQLYELPYEHLAAMAASERYGAAFAHDVDAASSRIIALERLIAAQATTLEQIRANAADLIGAVVGDNSISEVLRLWPGLAVDDRASAIDVMRTYLQTAPATGGESVPAASSRTAPRRRAGARGKRDTS